MKKKILGLFGSMILVLTMTVLVCGGCKKEPEVIVVEPESTVKQEVVSSEPVKSEVVEPEVVSEEPVVEVEENDELKVLEVSEDFAKANGCLCIYRNNKLYSLGPYIPLENVADVYYGQKVDDYRAATMFLNTPSTGKEVYTVGSSPDVIFDRSSDELRDYGGLYVTFYPCEFVGYTIDMWQNGSVYILPHIRKRVKQIPDSSRDTISISYNGTDLGGYSSTLKFDQGQYYKVSWYEGMDYIEYDMWSGTKKYKDLGQHIDPEFTMTKDGYRTLDFSKAEPGIYYSVGALPMTIK